MRSTRNSGLVSWGIFLGVTLILSVLVWTGWSIINRPNSTGGIGQSNTTVRIGVTDMPQSLNVRTTPNDAAERLLLDNVVETLLSVDQHNQLQPALATRWTTSEDGLTTTLAIRKNVTFSNGHTLDAADVVASLQQAVTNQVADSDELGNLTSVTNPDSSTVVITLSQPNPTLLRALSGRLGMVFDAEANDPTIGSGPFTVADFQPGQSLTLHRNDAYYGSKAAAGTITVTQYADDAAVTQALSNGNIDMIAPASATAAASFADQSAFTVSKGDTTDKVLLAYNSDTDALPSDEQVRKALRYLIDAAGIAASQPDSAGALGGPISPLETGYEDLTGLFPHDVNQAADMFGYFSPEFLPGVNLVVSEQYRALAETIAQQIGQVPRPQVNLEVLSQEDYDKRIQDGDWELTIISMSGSDGLESFANPTSMFHYNNAQAQALYAQAQASTNEEDYAKNIAAYARAVSEDAASDWLYTKACFTVASTSVSGYPTALIDQRMPLAGVTKS